MRGGRRAAPSRGSLVVHILEKPPTMVATWLAPERCTSSRVGPLENSSMRLRPQSRRPMWSPRGPGPEESDVVCAEDLQLFGWRTQPSGTGKDVCTCPSRRPRYRRLLRRILRRHPGRRGSFHASPANALIPASSYSNDPFFTCRYAASSRYAWRYCPMVDCVSPKRAISASALATTTRTPAPSPASPAFPNAASTSSAVGMSGSL